MKNLDIKWIISAFLFLLLNKSNLFAQLWVVNSETPGEGRIVAVATDNQGNIFATGYETRPSSGVDICTRKYKPNGQVEWERYYNGDGNGEDRAFGITVDEDGIVYVVGFSTGLGTGQDIRALRYTNAGVLQWEAGYNSTLNGEDRAFGIAVDSDGNVYVAGYVTLIGTDIYTIKFNSSGGYVWGQRINGTANQDDRAFGIVVDNIDSSIYVGGYTNNTATGTDITLACYNPNGDSLWTRNYNGSGNSTDRAFGIVVDNNVNENIYLTGFVTDTNGGRNCITLRYSSAGNLQWASRYNGPGNQTDQSFGIVIDTDNNTYITGFATALDTLTTDYMIAKYDSSGAQQWARTWDGPENYQDTALGIHKPKNSEFVFITGTSAGDTTGTNSNTATVKYNVADGIVSQVNIYKGEAGRNDAGTCITSDTTGNLFVGGYEQNDSLDYNWLVVKFLGGDIIGINVISTETPKSFNLYQNYPNPFNPVTKIKFDIQKAGSVKLKVFDILGREVAVLVNENLKTGSYEAVFGSNLLASGVYFYELSTTDFKEVKKMVLLK